jgi:hypothetical protein
MAQLDRLPHIGSRTNPSYRDQIKNRGLFGLSTTFTVRREKGERFGDAKTECLRSQETIWANPSSAEKAMRSRPLSSSNVELHVLNSKRNGESVPSDFTLGSAYPFAVEYGCPA